MAFSGKAHQLQAIVDKLKQVVDDIEEVCLVSHEGFTLVSTFQSQEEEESLSALASMVVDHGTRVLGELDCGEMTHLLLTGETRNLYFYDVGNAILAVLLDNDVDWSEVIPAIQWSTAKIRQHG